MMPITRRQLVQATVLAATFSAMPRLTWGANALQDTVLYVTLELGNPFFAELIDGLRSAIGSSPTWQLAVRAGKSADDASGQLQIMEAFLAQHQSRRDIRLVGLVLDPAQSGPELAGMVRQYNMAGVPVLNTDIPIDGAALTRTGAKIASFIGSNNLEGGKLAADVMSHKLDHGGDVLVLLGAAGSANAKNRRDGFVNRIQEIGTMRRTAFRVHEWNCNWSASEAARATDSMLGGGTPIRGIFAANDEMALGAVQSVSSMNLAHRPKPVIIGYDATPDARKAIRDGRMYASISQNPREMGERAIQELRLIVARRAVPAEVIIPVSAVVER